MVIKSILFDMDGVLIDSMYYHFLAWKKTFLKYNISINQKDIYFLEGSDYKQTVQKLCDNLDLNYSEELGDKMGFIQNNYFQNYKHNILPFKGINKLLNNLSNYSLAVVSGSNKENVENLINMYFPDIFEVIVSGEDTIKHKPFPNPYLKALSELDINFDEAIVIENSPLGISAAVGANIFCVALETSLSSKYLNEANLILKDHDELYDFLIYDLNNLLLK